ncbi:hypothetical protein E2C01_067653 [Portunus trituberculatus]|uniref:Uncharacterized protein n=1 Tax=Portunus trituberculatus TaxID=210409 RepID=A0A5B7HU89_PORTR|nr:hypothetical protein [Portunus trituberculatus]
MSSRCPAHTARTTATKERVMSEGVEKCETLPDSNKLRRSITVTMSRRSTTQVCSDFFNVTYLTR